MLELKDTAIKLFGKTIPLPLKRDALDGESVGAQPVAISEIYRQSSWDHTHTHSEEEVGREEEETQGKRKELPLIEPADNKHEEGTASQATVDPNNSNSSCIVLSPDTSPETSTPKKNVGDKEENETSISQGTTPKKPDQILPCPRCNSTDTKFCYFNNYNVNQPRHFCRNCQRYWTAGGSMRNVPVGAGRRKTKNSLAALYHHINVPEILHSARINASKTGGTVLMFGSDLPNFGQSQSTNSLPNPENGFFNPEKAIQSISRCIDKNRDDISGTSSQTPTVSNSIEKASECNSREPAVNYQALGWNSFHWNSGFPIAFYQELPSYWAYAPPKSANTAPKSLVPSSGNQGNSRLIQSSIKLGKHPRDGNALAPEKADWTPKTWSIDDCCKTSKRSIVGAVSDSGNSERLTQTFQSNAKGNNLIDRPTLVLQANPAALCRSLNFQESS